MTSGSTHADEQLARPCSADSQRLARWTHRRMRAQPSVLPLRTPPTGVDCCGCSVLVMRLGCIAVDLGIDAIRALRRVCSSRRSLSARYHNLTEKLIGPRCFGNDRYPTEQSLASDLRICRPSHGLCTRAGEEERCSIQGLEFPIC